MTPREVELKQQLEQCQEALAAAQRENVLLRQKLDALARRFFGVSSESLNPAQLQLLLSLPELSAPSAATPATQTTALLIPSRKVAVRKDRAPRLPEHLPVIEEVIDPEPVKVAPQHWRCIGAEVSEHSITNPVAFCGGARCGANTFIAPNSIPFR